MKRSIVTIRLRCMVLCMSVVLGVSAFGRTVLAAERLYLLAIGVNHPVKVPGADHPQLQFADDDAAALFEFVSQATDEAHLLTVMDPQTQALYPDLVKRARVPSRRELEAAVQSLADRVRRDRAQGDYSSVIVFFSGHGVVGKNGAPALLLSDTKLTRALLYDLILERLPASAVHLLVDACHAEAVVRPRDAHAEAVEVSASASHSFLVRSTLASFPHVGAIVASSTDRETHEWSLIQHGVFTYELLSALRGGADVNQDRLLEYSEVYAFMASANRGVGDRTVRLAIVAKPPATNRRTPLLDLSRIPSRASCWLVQVPHRAGVIHIGDGRGRRLSSLRTSPDFYAHLLLPAGAPLYVKNEGEQARFTPKGGEVVAFSTLRFERSDWRAKGYADEALRRGLFSNAYGRGYYLGFIDQDADFVPVEFQQTAQDDLERTPEVGRAMDDSFSAALTASMGLTSVVARDLGVGHGLQLGLRSGGAGGPAASIELSRAVEAGFSEWRGEVSAGYLRPTNAGKVRGWFGAQVGGGLIRQAAGDAPYRQSGVVSVSPITALSVDLIGRFSTWTELRYSGRGYREGGKLTVSFAPSVWIGAGVGL